LGIQFEHKQFIILFSGLGLLVLLFFALLQWKKNTARKIGDEKLVGQLTRNFSSILFILKFFLLLVAFALGVVAAMNPRKPGEAEAINRQGIDIAIALDVSKSMLASDLAPNRLERAKQFITKLMDQMPNDRIALVLFAGKAYLQMPMTADHGAARLFVTSATPDAVPQQGTIISDALERSVAAFNIADKKFKTVILISDGEDHDEEAVATAKKLAEQGVMINTVGIGSPEGSTIIDPATNDTKKDDAGNPVISKLNEEVLKEIALETNGVYIRLQGSDAAVAELSKKLSTIDPSAYTDISQVNFITYYAWIAGLMFVLLMVEIFIPEKRKNVAVA
jgi:Ca-activated chloride channel family protein